MTEQLHRTVTRQQTTTSDPPSLASPWPNPNDVVCSCL